MIHRIAPPIEHRQLLDRVDYADSFAATVDHERSAREWVALMLEHAHPAVIALVRFAHGRVGRMALAEADRDHPLGWTILEDTARRVVVGVEGGILTPRVMATVEPGRLVVTTALRYETGTARAVWGVGRHVHRAVARYLLTTAVRHG